MKNLGEEAGGEEIFQLAVAVVVDERVGVDEHGYQVTPGLQQQGYYTCFEVPLILKYQRKQ